MIVIIIIIIIIIIINKIVDNTKPHSTCFAPLFTLNFINCQDTNWSMWDCCSGRKWPVLCIQSSKAGYNSKCFHCEQALCRAWSSLQWLDDALSKFLNWIKPEKPCLLITHSAKGFDGKYLFRLLHHVACFMTSVKLLLDFQTPCLPL